MYMYFAIIVLTPYITESSTDSETIIITNVTCRPSDPIPSSVTVQCLHNSDDVVLTPSRILSTKSMDTAVLQIRDFRSSDIGVYQCVFNNTNPATGVWSTISEISVGGKLLYVRVYMYNLHQKWISQVLYWALIISH